MKLPDDLPAILMAGSPHSGKSVMAHLLSQGLRERGRPHFVLRADPAGEGDWFYTGETGQVQAIRIGHKRGYTAEFVREMCAAITARKVPLIVDAGGNPTGEEQYALLASCTDYILLYQSDADRAVWRERLGKMNLRPLAELRTVEEGTQVVTSSGPVIEGLIDGLQREKEKRRTGLAFAAVLEAVQRRLDIPADELTQAHLHAAPYTAIVNEDELATQLNVKRTGGRLEWVGADLAHLPAALPQGEALSIYGRGPVWLAAALACQRNHAALFDLIFGWAKLDQTQPRVDGDGQSTLWPHPCGAQILQISLPISAFLRPQTALYPDLRLASGLILSGKLPRWYFASLARFYARRCAWVAVYVPALKRSIVVTSQTADQPVGSEVMDPAQALQ